MERGHYLIFLLFAQMDRFCLTCRVKAALFDVGRGLKDDSHVWLGTDEHDNRKLEFTTSDHDLKLTDKVKKKPHGFLAGF